MTGGCRGAAGTGGATPTAKICPPCPIVLLDSSPQDRITFLNTSCCWPSFPVFYLDLFTSFGPWTAPRFSYSVPNFCKNRPSLTCSFSCVPGEQLLLGSHSDRDTSLPPLVAQEHKSGQVPHPAPLRLIPASILATHLFLLQIITRDILQEIAQKRIQNLRLK